MTRGESLKHFRSSRTQASHSVYIVGLSLLVMSLHFSVLNAEEADSKSAVSGLAFARFFASLLSLFLSNIGHICSWYILNTTSKTTVKQVHIHFPCSKADKSKPTQHHQIDINQCSVCLVIDDLLEGTTVRRPSTRSSTIRSSLSVS